MPTNKRAPKARPRTNAKSAARTKGKPARPAEPKRYGSGAWERVNLLSVELDALAGNLGLRARKRDPDGFDLVDAARELARLAGNHHRDVNPDGRTTSQEKADWLAVGGLGADLGNMADEGAVAPASDGVRHIAHELCFLACDYLF
jgi:hypothetical protein